MNFGNINHSRNNKRYNYTNNTFDNNNTYFMQPHIGGKNKPIDDGKYINNQTKILQQNRNQYLPPNPENYEKERIEQQITNYDKTFKNYGYKYPKEYDEKNLVNEKGIYYNPKSGRYDPYADYLFSKGLLDDGTNNLRFIKNYIDINSNYRKKLPNSIKNDGDLLSDNPLTLTKNSNTICVSHPNHGYNNNDLISLNGATTTSIILSTKNNDNEDTIIIESGCSVMKIFYEHGIPEDYEGSVITVSIDGIKGDDGSTGINSILGNIQTNIINSTFIVKTRLYVRELHPDCGLIPTPEDPNVINPNDIAVDFDPNCFYVILPKRMQTVEIGTPYVLTKYNYSINFRTLAGIPLNVINADYPITPDQRNGYHVIHSVTDDSYCFDVNTNAIDDIQTGGNCINIAKIDRIDEGYENPNKYTIELGKIYREIVSIRLISLEFPNSQSSFTEYNNKLYWNNIDDGDFLYSIEIPPGNYTPNQLTTILQNLFFNVDRYIIDSENITYEKNHYIQVSINTNTSEICFKPFKRFLLSSIIQNIEPSPPTLNTAAPPGQIYTLTISHPNHGLTSEGSIISISGAVEHQGIPPSILNTEHIVTEIVDENTYKIELPPFNFLQQRTISLGGNSVTIYVPDIFRLRFDFPDTAGTQLGFRNSGNLNSVTNFSTQVCNSDAYEFDDDTIVENNTLNLGGDNYIYMVMNPVNNISSNGPIKDFFAKIQLCDSPGNVLFNSYVKTPKRYNDPIHELTQLDISFYTQNGELYDFNGLEHSFTLEITTLNQIPSATHINANTGKNYSNI